MSDGSRPSRMPPARTAPRNVPMLTEVVGERLRRAAASTPPDQPMDISVHLAQAVLAQIEPALEQRLSEAIARVLHEQMLGLNARVRRAVADEVRSAVSQALERTEAGASEAPPSSHL